MTAAFTFGAEKSSLNPRLQSANNSDGVHMGTRQLRRGVWCMHSVKQEARDQICIRMIRKWGGRLVTPSPLSHYLLVNKGTEGIGRGARCTPASSATGLESAYLGLERGVKSSTSVVFPVCLPQGIGRGARGTPVLDYKLTERRAGGPGSTPRVQIGSDLHRKRKRYTTYQEIGCGARCTPVLDYKLKERQAGSPGLKSAYVGLIQGVWARELLNFRMFIFRCIDSHSQDVINSLLYPTTESSQEFGCGVRCTPAYDRYAHEDVGRN
ncbi:hypothetical protein B0H11DRAFT_1913604 [Mycena galericulata]|nr:hypothetical protein B0H11DRAFT_1913604 [Mycena galericulata]